MLAAICPVYRDARRGGFSDGHGLGCVPGLVSSRSNIRFVLVAGAYNCEPRWALVVWQPHRCFIPRNTGRSNFLRHALGAGRSNPVYPLNRVPHTDW